jgi:TRAP-type mannitol/chloroaromatic compound transport system substrate-binding protein
MAKYDSANPAALRRLVAGGAQLRAFPRPVMEAAEKAAYDLYDELSAKNPDWKRLYDNWRKFRDEQFLWFRVAEHTFEAYMYSSKIGRG